LAAYRPSVGNGVAGADHRPSLAELCLAAARPGFLLTRLGWNAGLVAALGAIQSVQLSSGLIQYVKDQLEKLGEAVLVPKYQVLLDALGELTELSDLRQLDQLPPDRA